MAEEGSDSGLLHRYATGVRSSLGNNAGAYAYSVTITATFGVLTSIAGPNRVVDVFTFAAGAAAAFTLTEAVASRGFRVRMRSEPPDVIVLGSAIAFPSVLLAVAAGALGGDLLMTAAWPGAAWPVGSVAATTVFLLVSAGELLLGARAKRAKGVEEQDE